MRSRDWLGCGLTMPVRLLFLVVATLPIAACARFEPVTAAQLDRGCVIMLPGVANGPSSMLDIAKGLREGEIDYAIQQELWGDRPFGALKNVMALERNRKLAAGVAAKVAEYGRNHPRQPIILIGNSGGGAMAIFVCEALPKEVQVDRVILLAAAIAPDYDLGPALGHCRQGLINYYSEGDWFDAGILTTVFGTMDRKHTSTAGRQGFLDSNGQLATGKGLAQIAWRPAWRRLGHGGGHPGWGSRAWAREVLAPLIRGDAPTAGEGVLTTRPSPERARQ